MVIPAEMPRRGPRLLWLIQRLLHDAAPRAVGVPLWVGTIVGSLQAVSLLAAFWTLMRSQQTSTWSRTGRSPRRSIATSPPTCRL
ncbi:hypothetical protein [Mariniluteicoccus endophyticus]